MNDGKRREGRRWRRLTVGRRLEPGGSVADDATGRGNLGSSLRLSAMRAFRAPAYGAISDLDRERGIMDFFARHPPGMWALLFLSKTWTRPRRRLQGLCRVLFGEARKPTGKSVSADAGVACRWTKHKK